MPENGTVLPRDADAALLVGRVWDAATGGPRPVLVRGDQVHDLFDLAGTVSELLDRRDPVPELRGWDRPARWQLADLSRPTAIGDLGQDHLLPPVDLQVVKACGVTFVDSMIERVIEERCAGDASRAAQVRAAVTSALGDDLASIRPGSPEAAQVKEVLSGQGLWSQYLEVGLGPDPEIFTKAPVLSSVGPGARVGVPAFSAWNNPEPELVLVVDSTGQARGATLGNDVNLRDVEGRSALLLGMAKDNNASSALGPFVRVFDEDFTPNVLRQERIRLQVQGTDGYRLDGENDVARLSRDFDELIDAAYGAHHQYPDGFVLFTGTLFAPTQDRDSPGLGFTHKVGDLVSISSDHLGTLTNEVAVTDSLPPWTFGIRALMAYVHEQTRP